MDDSERALLALNAGLKAQREMLLVLYNALGLMDSKMATFLRVAVSARRRDLRNFDLTELPGLSVQDAIEVRATYASEMEKLLVNIEQALPKV